MKKLKKSLSVLLTLVMLFTTLCFFPLDFGKVEADAAVPGIKIVVPETLYLTPSTGASTTIQYYINNNADGSVSVSQDTSAKVHITYPGAKLTSVSAKTSAAITLPASITGLVGTTFGSSATTATGTFSLPAGLNAGGTALVEWTFVFDVNGKTQTHYAYSIAYAPWYQPVGAAAKAKGAYHNTFASSILWVSGVHGYSDGDSNSRWYIQTANFIPMLGTIKAPGNNNPDTNWIQSGSNGLSPTINYQDVEAGGTKYHARANSISPTANLTVDTSRYSNFNQIPNFSVGFMVTDRENANEGPTWYVSDFTGQTSSYYNGTATGSSEYSGDFNSSGTKFSSGDDTSTGIKYNGTWNKAISGTASFRIKSAVKTKTNKVIDTTAWNNNFVNISVTGANKGTLRTNVLNGTSYAKENYTADTWNTYYSALKTAATNLCNPTSATVDTSALTTAEANLHTTLTLNANGGAIGDGVPNSVAMQVGGGTTSSFNNADVINAYYATRTGYTFLGWSTDKDATSAPATVTVGFNDTVYAVWKANEYQVVFDNLIDYPAWNKAAGNGTVSDITDNGFTITSNDGAGESTSESPYFPVTPGKKYKVHMDITGTAWDVYIFFCDADGNWVDFADGPSNRYSTGGSTGVDPENAIFTAPDKVEVVKAKIRVDANGSNNTVRFENIRVFEVDNENADISYEAPIMVTYDQPFGTLPTPTRTGYEFQGWVDESGTPYASSTKVAITETLRLYSTWELGTYTITFDTKGGNAINSISGHYNDPVTKPADPTKDGYLFTGWDKTIPDTIPPENTTITATWSENSYAVFFDGNGQTGGTPNEQINTTYTGEITIPECTYEKNGYTFSYWTTNKDGTGTKYYAGDKVSKLTTVRNGGVTLYAQWAVNSYDITYVYDNGTGETKVIPFDINATVNALAAPQKVGHTFAGWKVTSAEGNWELGAVVDEGVTATGMYGNVTLTAQWTVNQYTITFDADGGTAVAPITQDFGTAITAPAEPTKTGYKFAGWDALPSTMPADDIIVKAIWTVDQFTVTYVLDNGEADIIQTYDFGATVTAPAAPTKTGYTFAGWENLPETMPANNVTVTAKWTVNQYTITYKLDNGEADVVQTYDFGAAVTEPTAPTKTGYDFAGWSSTIPGTMPATNLDVTATWTIKKFDVTFNFKNVDGTDAAVTIPAVEYGTAFSDIAVPVIPTQHYLSADAENHYNFTAWDKKIDTITEAVVFTAQYEAEAHIIWEDIEHAKAPDCVNAGVIAVGCDCGYRHQETAPATGHSYKDVEGTNTATCTEGGFVTQKCSVCNDTISVATGPLGHKNKEEAKENEVAATCTTEGSYDMVVRCERCNEVQETEHFTVAAKGHTFGDITEAVAPGCTTTGNSAYKSCSVCNKFFAAEAAVDSTDAKDSAADFVVGAAGHKTVLVEAVAPECEEDGNIAYYTCENCYLLFSDAAGTIVITLEDTVDPMTGHNYVAVVTPPTCLDDGYTTHTCSNCNDKYTDTTVGALGHTPGEETIENNVNPTCTTDGSYDTVTYCTVCGVKTSSVTTVVGSLGHSEGAAKEENRIESTCTVKGSYDSVVYCIVCNEKLSSVNVELPLADHKYVAEVTPPTCLTGGYTTHTCSVCHEAYEDSYVDALGHTAGEKAIENNVKPDCTTAGSYDEVVYCTVCGEELSRNNVTVDPLGHDYDAVVTDPTCTEDGYTTYTCKVCDDTYTADETDALGHKPGAAVEEKDIPATCTVNGSYEEVVYCSVCNTELSREAKVNVAPGHTEDVRQENVENATCTVAGSYDNVTYCTVCNEVLKTEKVAGVTLPHAYEEVIIDAAHLKTEATCVSYAVYYYDCKDCTANAKDAGADTFEYVQGGKNEANHTTTSTTLKNDVAATCYEDGYSGNMYHDCCDTIAEYGYVISKDTVAHTAGAIVVENNVAPTCYSEGSYDNVTYCSVCEAAGEEPVETSRDTVIVPKTAHTPATAVQEKVTPATCYAEGSYDEVVYCSVEACHEKLSTTPKTIEKIAHTPGVVVVENNVAPTCYSTGSYDNVTYCSVCAAADREPVETSRDTVIVPKTAHTPGEAVRENVVEATCYSEGSYNAVVYCSVEECGHKISSTPKTIDKTAHTPAEAIQENVTPATCYSEGSYNEVVYCSVEACHEKLSTTPKTIEKIAHTPGAVVIENEIEATCYSTGSYDNVTYCTVCKEAGKGDVQVTREPVTVVMKAHTPGEAVTENVVAPKCEEDGSHDVVVYCSVCAAAGRKTEISRETVVDTMTGHTEGEAKVENNVPATCTENGSYDLVVRCTKCNEIITSEAKVNVAPGHKAGAAVTENVVKATCTVGGTYEEATYCTVCGVETSRDYKTTEALGHTAAQAVIENEVKVTCTTDGSYDTVVYCGICNTELSRETTVEGAPGHKAGEVVYENITPATETENGKRDEVTYCTVCNTELSRETVVLKPVRIITFIMHDETIEIEAHTGDTLTAPEVQSYESADGFIHQFKSWDKELAVVTGAATYTAIYTEPCDYTEIDRLEETLNDILAGGLVDDETLNEYKDKIDDIKAKLEVINANRNTLDKDNQADIDVVVGDLEELVDYIYPDVGSTLEIVGASTFYTGSILDLKAVKMPANAVISDVQWTSSDDSIVFCSNGKLFAIGIGKVTITAKRGILTATKTINVVEGGDVRAINFISMDKAHIIVEDYFTVFNAAGLYWSDANEIRFRVHVYQNFPYETYIVYINGVEAEADADGYYTVPANAGNVRVSIAGAVYKDDADGTGSSGKWSFWEWLLMIFRKIAALFGIEL